MTSKRDSMPLRKYLLAVCLAFVALGSVTAMAAPGIDVVTEGASDLNGKYSEKVVDMELKVLGGSMSLVRAYRNGEWMWSPGFDLPEERSLFATSFAFDSFGQPLPQNGLGCSAGCHGSVTQPQLVVNDNSPTLLRVAVGSILYRNGDFYRHNNIVSEDQPDNSVLKTETLVNANATRFLTRVSREIGEDTIFESARWRDLAGNFMHYGVFGATTWGNRYGVTNKIERDSTGRIERIKDHNDRVIYTFAYVGETDQVQSVTDIDGRTVQYAYNTEDKLAAVTDVRGKVWLYDDTIDYLKTDPDGRTLSVKMAADGVVKEISRGGSVTKYAFGFDSTTDLPAIVTTTSPAGVQTTKRFDGQNRLSLHQVAGVALRSITRQEEDDGRLTETETDETGYKVIRVRDVRNNITSISYPDETKELYSYDLRFNFVKSFTNRNGITETYEYDANGNYTKRVEAVGTHVERATTYEYDTFGRLNKTTWVGDANTATVTNEWTYDANGNIATFTDGEGNLEQYQDYDGLGNYTKLIDGRGKTWLLSYDPAGNQLTLTNPLGKITTLEYDGAGNLNKSILPTTAQTLLAYDGQSRLKQVTDALGKNSNLAYEDTTQTLTVSDALGNTVSMKQNPFDQISQLVDPTGNVTTLNYDARRLSSISFPTFNQAVTYDSDNRIKQVENVLSDADNQTTQLDYDAVGNLISSLDAESNEHQFELDELDRVSKIIDPINGETVFAYDERGNLTRVTDPEGRQTAFEYNGNDQLIAEVIDLAPNQTRREYDYDGNGLLTAIRTPAGARITFTYNDAAQLTQSDVYTTLVAATADKTITFGRDDAGRLTSYNDGTTSAAYTYDLLDRVTSVTTDFGPFSKSYGYSYYDNGWIRTYTNPENITYTYTYHADGSLAGVAIPGEGQISLSNYRWLAPQTVTLPGGLNLNANYDDLLRLETYEMKDAAGQLIASGDYQYDKVNNIDQIATEADIKDYGYDDLYRLTNATFTEGAATTNQESYGYDGVGNRLTAANDPAWVYNGKNQLISHENTTYEYDLNGNRSKKTILLPDTSTEETNYIYNPEERLVRVEDGSGSAMGEYYYDPFGLRLKKVASGATTYFLYNSEGLAAEYDATGNLIAEYHYGPNKPWMTDPLLQKRDGVYYYYQTDHLGTPQKLLAKSGLVVWQGEYSSFGEVTESVNTVTSLLRFPGQYEDGESGTHYNRFRTYDSRTGRYISRDPLGLIGGIDVYGYGYASPVFYSDPNGLICISPLVIASVSGAVDGIVSGGIVGASRGGRAGAVAGATVGGIIKAAAKAGARDIAKGAVTGVVIGAVTQSFSGTGTAQSVGAATIIGAATGGRGAALGGATGALISQGAKNNLPEQAVVSAQLVGTLAGGVVGVLTGTKGPVGRFAGALGGLAGGLTQTILENVSECKEPCDIGP
jgi:RHS repeat-associated protein